VSSARKTVLICDEDRAHTQTLAEGLERLGYAVEMVRSYAEAFAIACAHDIDALVVAPFL
jgi:ActR/RegA family two-component response regulator